MKTLAVRDGDLVVGPKGHTILEGEAKTRQDLGLALREPWGVDRFHPDHGSLLYRYVGEPVGIETEALIRAEIFRVVKNLIANQEAILTADNAKGAKPRFTTNEVISGVEGVDVAAQYDRYYVRVRLRTLAGSQIQQTLAVEG